MQIQKANADKNSDIETEAHRLCGLPVSDRTRTGRNLESGLVIPSSVYFPLNQE